MSTLSTTATDGLSTSDVEGIREGLAAGRKPKVMFTASAGQIAGEIGQVVKLNDPEESDDWVVVRFGRDELPFPPTDLTMPPRGRAAKATTPPASSAPAESTPPASGAPATAQAPSPPPPPAGTAQAGSEPARANETSRAKPAAPAPRASRDAAKKPRTAKSKQPPGLTVTLAYDSGEWTVAAQQGSKVLAKPYLVKPSEALKLVALLDVPGVQEAVEAIVNAERAEAAQRAEQLRGELAEVEARLAELG